MSEKILHRKTPVMGWASWNCFRTDITEERLKAQIDALKAAGLDRYGYEYFNIDDGFFGGRGADGALLFHRERFPNGIRPIADYAHERGLKAGIYSDGGDHTCGFYYDGEGDNGSGAGLYLHEEQDLKLYLEDYGFDFIKVDWCGGLRLGLDEREQYTKIARIIERIRERTGRCIVYNICRWLYPGRWAAEIADSWRTGADITPEFESVLSQIDNIKPLAKLCRPGHVNDLDMMQLGNGMSEEEERTHFAMWCMMSTPLMIGCDLTRISEGTLRILKNEELIAVNQDGRCRQAYVVKEFRSAQGALLGEIWVKELEENGAKAVAFLNRSGEPLAMDIRLADAGLRGEVLSVRDLCAHRDVEPAEALRLSVCAHGVAVFRIKSGFAEEAADLNAHLQAQEPCRERKITGREAEAMLAEGAVLLDVRSREEYEAGHMEGAVNLPYTDLHADAPRTVPDKDRRIIVYCATGKRSSQAKYTLVQKGYQNVFYLGGVDVSKL